MNTKLSIGLIVMTALTLTLSSVVVNHAWAANSAGADTGQGHEKTGSKGNSGQDRDGGCSGNSGGNGCAEDIHAGKSDQIKVEGTCCGKAGGAK
jgi:hypothetical protein